MTLYCNIVSIKVNLGGSLKDCAYDYVGVYNLWTRWHTQRDKIIQTETEAYKFNSVIIVALLYNLQMLLKFNQIPCTWSTLNGLRLYSTFLPQRTKRFTICPSFTHSHRSIVQLDTVMSTPWYFCAVTYAGICSVLAGLLAHTD